METNKELEQHIRSIDDQMKRTSDDDLAEGVACEYCGEALNSLHVLSLLEH